MKNYADNKSYVQQSIITTGDTVLVKPAVVRSKLQTPFGKDPMVVIEKKGSMITAERRGHRITRKHIVFQKSQR